MSAGADTHGCGAAHRGRALDRAARLMEAALAILDDTGHPAAARLDHAIVDLGRARIPPTGRCGPRLSPANPPE